MGRELRHDPVPGIVIVILVVVGSLAAPWLALRFLEDRGAGPLGAATVVVAAVAPAESPDLPAATGGSSALSPLSTPPAPVTSVAASPTAAATPAESSSPTPTPSPSVTPSATATLAATAPPTASATPTMTPSPTPTPTRLPVIVLRAPPTATPTPAPTATRRPPTRAPTRTPSVAQATATPRITAGFVSFPALVAPAPGRQVSGVVRFEWLATGPLPEGAGYEVVWWNSDEPAVAARGLAPPTSSASLDINLDPLYANGTFRGSQLYWTVLVVQVNPYVRLTAPGAGETGTIYYVAGAGG